MLFDVFSGSRHGHRLIGVPSLSEKIGHQSHRAVDVFEEGHVLRLHEVVARIDVAVVLERQPPCRID